MSLFLWLLCIFIKSSSRKIGDISDPSSMWLVSWGKNLSTSFGNYNMSALVVPFLVLQDLVNGIASSLLHLSLIHGFLPCLGLAFSDSRMPVTQTFESSCIPHLFLNCSEHNSSSLSLFLIYLHQSRLFCFDFHFISLTTFFFFDV